ncbi:MAG: hypothetical protein D6732_04475, partial [Methanobacteriota archaeon]
MVFISNRWRPFFGGWRTVFIISLLKLQRNVKISGWKYFFASSGVVRLEKGRLSISSGSWFEKGVLLHCIDGHLS